MSRTEPPKRRKMVYDAQVDARTLRKHARCRALPVDADAHPVAEEQTILKGRISFRSTNDHLAVHGSDCIETGNFAVHAELKPTFTIVLMLAGKVHCEINGAHRMLSAEDGPKGYIWQVDRPMSWSRHLIADMLVRKVVLTVNRDWLLGQIGDEAHSRNWLNGLTAWPVPEWREWEPSKRAVGLAEQILNPLPAPPLLHNVQMEAQALSLLAEALETQLTPTQAEPDSAPIRAQRIRDYIEGRLDDELTLSSVGKALGMATASLQRTFKAAYGLTVMDYIRARRLAKARDGLERGDLTITQAAHVAGYRSAANFSTAFKRTYGLSPSDLGV